MIFVFDFVYFGLVWFIIRKYVQLMTLTQKRGEGGGYTNTVIGVGVGCDSVQIGVRTITTVKLILIREGGRSYYSGRGRCRSNIRISLSSNV